MARKSPIVMALVLSGMLVACGSPFVLLPGGALEGEKAPVPESWAFTDEVDTIQLETNPLEPYSVNIWAIALDGNLYVHAGASRSRWIENMEADPRVRLKVSETIYELAASRVEGQDEFDRFSDTYEKKYGNRPRNESVSEAYLFRLKARS
jgi:hypothetical protein